MSTEHTSGKPAHGRIRAGNTLRYLFMMTRRGVMRDLLIFMENIRLMVGSLLLVGGLLSIKSGRYCDGTFSDHFACTRPATYYYYDEVTIGIILLGVLLILLWYMRRVFDYDSP